MKYLVLSAALILTACNNTPSPPVGTGNPPPGEPQDCVRKAPNLPCQ